jgi:hypothetical protein
MNIQLKTKFDAQLPATPCLAEMRERIDQIAREKNTSIAEVMRFGIAFFLQNYANISSSKTYFDSINSESS